MARSPPLCNGFVHVVCWCFLSLTSGWWLKSSSPRSSLLTLIYLYSTDSLCKGHSQLILASVQPSVDWAAQAVVVKPIPSSSLRPYNPLWIGRPRR